MTHSMQASLVGEVMYCTVMLTEVPVVCAIEKTSGLWVIQDVSLKRPQGSSVGILLRNAEEGTQVLLHPHCLCLKLAIPCLPSFLGTIFMTNILHEGISDSNVFKCMSVCISTICFSFVQ